jgi:3-hydroxyanthranilate 3,4-dioxygenase
VVERRRRPGERDGFQWFCEQCQHLLYEEFFELTSIETQFPPIFERFFANRDLRTCKRCGAVMERAG